MDMRELRQLVEGLDKLGFDAFDRREIIEEMYQDDFECCNYRFIHSNEIGDILVEELSSDTYVLGCFNSWFIAEVTGIDSDTVKRMQVAEGYDALGELMLRDIGKVADRYATYDGYGHHFGHYDGKEHKIGDWYVFRVN